MIRASHNDLNGLFGISLRSGFDSRQPYLFLITSISFAAWFDVVAIIADVFLFNRLHFVLTDFAEEGHGVVVF